MLAERVQLRLSRAEISCLRAFRKILKSRRQADLAFGRGVVEPLRIDDRREESRYILQVPVYIWPVERRGLTIEFDKSRGPSLAIAEDLSLHGVGLSHDAPLPAPLFLVEFDVLQEQPLYLLVESRWHLPEIRHALRTGGRILGVCR